MKNEDSLRALLRIMARLRSPRGCPWDRQQNHRSIRYHAIEEVYELLDAIEAGDDQEMIEELGDLLLQVVFHCQLARERKAFDFATVATNLAEKLIRRHPHVFGQRRNRSIGAIWAQWERIKKAEKQGTRNARKSAFDGIPGHLPALSRAEKLAKKARRAGWEEDLGVLLKQPLPSGRYLTRSQLGKVLFSLVVQAQARGWSAEEILRDITNRHESAWRKEENLRRNHPSLSDPENPTPPRARRIRQSQSRSAALA